MYDYGARNYDPALGRTTTIDPMAEKFYDLSPQSFLNNNPLTFIDPTGMSSDDWKINRCGEMEFDSGLTKENASTRLAGGETYVGQEAQRDNGNGTTNFYNADGSSSTAINLAEIQIDKYSQGEGTYFDRSNYGKGENPYSPYIPDGAGVTFAGSADINYTTYNASFSLVLDFNKNTFAGFGNMGAGLSTNRISLPSASASIDIHDTYGGSDLFGGLEGYSKGGSASFFDFGGSHYQSARPTASGQLIFNPDGGVKTNSLFFNVKPSVGANAGFLYSKRWF